MPIQVECPSCRAAIQVPDEDAGRRGRCPRCEAVLVAAAAEPGEIGYAAAPAASAPSSPPDLDGDGAGYAPADAPRRAKAVRPRAESLPGVGVSARGVAAAAAPTTRTLTAPEILAAFGGRIEPVRPTLLYRAWILIVALVMVTLPVVYVAIIGLVVAAVLYHAVHHITIFQHVRGSGATKGAALLYVAPIISGGIVVLLMVKPLFARPPRGPKARALDPAAEPLLFSFVEAVCNAVGSPRPARIEVDCRVNASAHRDGGLLGVVGGRLVLTIGLPFAAGVSLRQFAGVLAHEFGHFSQGAGMRLYGLIMRINLWFARVVYQRDAWDEELESWSAHEHIGMKILGGVTRLAVWLTRRFLWALMFFGHVVSGFLSRQMEYDADRYEARMVGAGCFAETMWRFRVLGLAEQGAYADLRSTWQQRRLPEDFPKLVMANIPQVPEGVVEAVRKEMERASTALFSTHPADRDRIARARRDSPGEGIFHLEGPATDIFQDFDALARATSLEMYRASLGEELGPEQLFAVSELVETQAAAQEGAEASRRFFLGALDLTRRLPIPAVPPAAPADAPAAEQDLAASRRELQAARPGYLESSRLLKQLGGRLTQAELALVLRKAGVWFRASDYNLPVATTQAAEAARDEAEAGMRRIAQSDPSHPFAVAAVARLTGALGLLEDDLLADRVADGRDRRDEARALYRCVAHLAGSVMPELARLARARSVLAGAFQVFNEADDPTDQFRIDAVLRAASDLRDRFEEFREKVGDAIAYPFEHASEGVTLGKFALPAPTPSKEDVRGLMGASGEVIDRLARLHVRALGRLTLAAEEVERTLGLPPIVVEDPEPVETA
jgi:Zn-dependent protease with chaperone function